MEYYLILLASTASIISVVHGEIPNYIPICKRADPDLSGCIAKSINVLRPKLISGIEDIGVQPLDPLYIDRVTLPFGPGFHAEGRNLSLSGAGNFKIIDLSANITENVCNFTVSLPEMTATGTYVVDAMIAAIPLKGTGPFQLSAKSIIGRGTLRGKLGKRGGKIYNWFPNMTLKFDVEDYDVKLQNLFNGDPVIGEATNRVLNDNKAEVLEAMRPTMEQTTIKYILDAANKITTCCTFDELFPLD